ncbi:MAG: glycoside hydrolase family 2 TIM barrel-domain containing protein [Bacteroidales bacterium]
MANQSCLIMRPQLIACLIVLFIQIPGPSQGQKVPEYIPKPVSVAEVENVLLSLTGPWNFSADPGTAFWRSPDPARINWKRVQVPGEWTMQGFMVVPGTRAAYWKEVAIPTDWKGRRVILKADGFYSDAIVFLNGRVAGTHEGGFTPAEFDLSHLIRPGKKNDLVIGLVSESLADTLASATQYAAHQLGGITRKLEMFVLPECHFSRFNLYTDLDDRYHDAFLNMEIGIRNHLQTVLENLAVDIRVYQVGNDRDPVAGNQVPIESIDGGGDILKELSVRVFNPDKWDPEHPHLYRVVMSLKLGNQLLETIEQKFGFREIVVAGNQVFVNGRPVKLRGVCRHEVHPLKGRSLGMEEWAADARLFKEANVNYVRTSHYPPGEEFIDLCDSIGLFVELEAPVCWVGHGANNHWQTSNPHDNKLYHLIRQQVLESVAHYRNHPSILIWSMANESAWGPIWDTILKEVNSIDPTRPVSFHDQSYGGYNNFGSKAVQIANFHYPGPAGPERARKNQRPMLFGEYCHLNCYNRQELSADPGIRDSWGRGLESMWENMFHSAGILGGAIWSGVDDVFYLNSGNAVGYGEWGPIDGWRRQKPEYWHLKKSYSPVRIFIPFLDVPRAGQPIRIPVENRHQFTNLSEMDFVWKLGAAKGRVTVEAEPGQTGLLVLNPQYPVHQDDELEIEVWSPQKYMVDKYRIGFNPLADHPVRPTSRTKPELVIQGDRVMVSAAGFEYGLDARTGRILAWGQPGAPVLTGGPDLQMLPLTSGPCVTDYQLDIEPLNTICSGWDGRVTGTGKDVDNVWVLVEGTYEEAGLVLKYVFDTLGQVVIDYEITSKMDVNPRQVGLVFEVPVTFDQLTWERQAQWPVYPENHIGRPKGMARPFPPGDTGRFRFGVKPDWHWSLDTGPQGSNDFRATRENIYFAALSNPDNHGLVVTSKATDAVRCWVEGDKIQVLVAGFHTGGGDIFFAPHHEKERRPLKRGDKFNGRITLMID